MREAVALATSSESDVVSLEITMSHAGTQTSNYCSAQPPVYRYRYGKHADVLFSSFDQLHRTIPFTNT